MKTSLLFGKKTVDLELPDSVALLEMKNVEAISNPTVAVHEALTNPIESQPLEDLAKGKRDACIVISDITRPVPNQIILPPILGTLQENGIPKEKVTILIANGMHRPNLGKELESMVGSQIMDTYNIENHYCRKPAVYRKIDEIDGAPIEINRHYLDADLKILTGLIEPHFYAGYSGGRKSILPGISSFETMKFMHSYQMIDHPKVTNCLIEGNPFHEYGLRVAELAGVDFILNVVINKERNITSVFAGDYNQAHLAGCEMVQENSVVQLDEAVDMVITSGGGYPLDATFYQISKALICAADILREGGTILVACECSEGLGSPEFCSVLECVSSPKEFTEKYSDPKNFVIDQWCVHNIHQALNKAGRVYIYSHGLSHDDLQMIGAFKVDNIEGAVNKLVSENENVVAIPDGPYVVGRVG